VSKADWRRRLNRKWREHVFLAATRAFGGRRGPYLSFGVIVAGGIAACILLATAAFAGAGLYLLLFDFPNLVAGGIGLLFLALAYVARPRFYTQQKGMPIGAFPGLEQVLNSLSSTLNAPKIETVEFTSDWNAGVWQELPGRGAHLSIGLPLLNAASRPARVAILAHEVADLVNSDPRRGSLIFAARQTISEWLCSFGYSEIAPPQSDVAGAGELVRQMIGLALFGTRALMDRATFFASQKAEYLADGLSAKISGDGSMREALLLTASSFHLDRELRSFVPLDDDRGLRTLEFLKTAADLDVNLQQERQDRMTRELLSTDHMHPPTNYRLAFIETLGPMQGQLVVDDACWAKIEAEIAPYCEALGADVLSRRSVHL